MDAVIITPMAEKSLRRGRVARLLGLAAPAGLAAVLWCGPAADAATAFERCSDLNEPTAVQVNPCPEEPCSVQLGQPVTIEAKFTAPADAASPRLTLQMQQHDLWTDVPGMEDADVCSADRLSPSCPMVKDKEYTLTSTWTPGSDMPWAGDVKLRWRLDERVEENAVTTLLCFTHDVQIHD